MLLVINFVAMRAEGALVNQSGSNFICIVDIFKIIVICYKPVVKQYVALE